MLPEVDLNSTVPYSEANILKQSEWEENPQQIIDIRYTDDDLWYNGDPRVGGLPREKYVREGIRTEQECRESMKTHQLRDPIVYDWGLPIDAIQYR